MTTWELTVSAAMAKAASPLTTKIQMDSDARIRGMRLAGQDWFRVSHSQLDMALVGKRLCFDYIQDSPELQRPYRAHQKYGGHLPNRVIALSHTIGDMLKLGDFPLSLYPFFLLA